MDGGQEPRPNVGQATLRRSDADRSQGASAVYQPLVVVFIAVAAGVVGDRYFQALFPDVTVIVTRNWVWLAVLWTLSVTSVALWCVAWRDHRDVYAGWLLLVAVAFVAASWHHLNWYTYGRGEIARYAHLQPQPACIEAIACGSPERVAAPRSTPLRAMPGTEQSRLLVSLTGIRDGKTWRPASGVCQVAVVGHVLWVRPGDRLRVFGQLARISPPLNPGEFDFAANARAEHRLARFRCSTPECVKRVAAGSRFSAAYGLDAMQLRAKQVVRSSVGPQRAGLANAILLGAREGLPFEETEPYLETGTIHVLVVSGMNVAILAVGLIAMLRLGWLSRKLGLCLVMAVVVVYALLAEAQPPVVRAAVLGILACVALWTWRRWMAFNSLFAAAIVVVAINPNDFFRAGPQLSFLAVAALILVGNMGWMRPPVADPLQELERKSQAWYLRAFVHVKSWCRGLLITSAAVWLLTLPLVVYTFHIVSPVAIPASLAVWPLVTIAMWSGFLMVVSGWLVPWLGAASGTICGWSLAWLEGLVRWADALPCGHFWSPGPTWWWVAAFYLGLLALILGGRNVVPLRWQVAIVAIWTMVGFIPPILRAESRSGLECSFLAVGHGACVVVQGAGGETVVYDAGSMGAPEYVTQSIAGYLWNQGITRIDGIIISHADTDHYNAVPGLLERFRVGAIYVSPVMFEGAGEVDTSRGTKVLRDSIQHSGVPIHEIWAGDRLRISEDLAIGILHPPEKGVVGPDNANSIAALAEYAGRRLLLPGDLESPGLEDLLAESPVDSDIVLTPHHGSRRSDPPGFAAWCTPEWAIISGGGNDDVSQVERTYQQAGATVLYTRDTGAVSFLIERGKPVKTSTWLKESPAAINNGRAAIGSQ